MAITKVTTPVTGFESGVDEGLKITVGTNSNRPTGVEGMIRNDTDEDSGGTDSTTAITFYNGTAWKYFNSTKSPLYPTSLKMFLNASNTTSYPGTGATWFDLTNNNNDGTIGGATWNSSGYFSFDGTNDRVLLPQLSPSEMKTVNFWINSSTSQNGFILSMGNYNLYTWLNIRLNAGKLEAGYGSNNGGYMFGSAIRTSSLYNNNTWINVTCTFTGVYGIGQMPNIYVNGVDVAASTFSPTYTGTQTTTGAGAIGYYFPQNILYVNALISNFRIYDTVLTNAEITALFNEGR